jgi:repressor LexA
MCSRPSWRRCWAASEHLGTPGTTDSHWTEGRESDTSVPDAAFLPPVPDDLTPAQQELYDWLSSYIGSHRHSPSIRQMMEAMKLRSPAPIQSRLRHLQQKGWITWQEGQARTLQLLGGAGQGGIPVLGAVAAGGLIEPFSDTEERLDLAPLLETRGLFALTVNGDSMVEAHIADGDVVLLEPVKDASRLREGTIVSALVPGSGTTLKHFHRQGAQVRLEAANPAYGPILVPAEEVTIQGKLVAVWRQV